MAEQTDKDANPPADEKKDATGGETPNPEAQPAGKLQSFFHALPGLLVWVAIIGTFIYFRVHIETAELLADVSPNPASVSGIVLLDGNPVNGGMVQITVSDAKKHRYLAGAVIPVGAEGRFSAEPGSDVLSELARNTALRIDVQYFGSQQSGKDSSRAIKGETTRWLNFSPPVSARALWIFASCTLFVVFTLTFLFTGQIGRAKARMLFGMMYFMTFMSLAVPIGITIWVAQNQYLVEMMEKAPIGLIRARSSGTLEPQWLINVGGTVFELQPGSGNQRDAEARDGKGSDTSGAATSEAPKEASLIDLFKGSAEDKVVHVVVGGITVPFYVILLAIFGAGINMTRRVPQIQDHYDRELGGEELTLTRILSLGLVKGSGTHRITSTPSPFGQPASSPDSGANGQERRRPSTPPGIRMELVQLLMYVLSAPFLAIAVYYMLLIVAKEIAQPVLVIMAFATGLASELIVSWIIEFAEEKFRHPRDEEAVQTALPPAEEAARNTGTAATAGGASAPDASPPKGT